MAIVVFGSINQDITVTCSRMPSAGETLSGSSVSYVPGGKGANQAVAAARLGVDVIMLGCVGTDATGTAMLDNLEAKGVDVSHVERRSEVATGIASIIVADDDNMIVVVPGANGAVDAAYAERCADVIASADMLMLQHEVPAEANLAAACIAHEAGVPVTLNPAPARDVSPELLGYVTLLTPNEHELGLVLGDKPVDRLLRSRPQGIVVTLGGEGSACALANGEICHVPAMGAKVVDTTGAGDTFCGALATSLVRGDDLPGAMRYASVAASLSVTKAGAQGGMPTASEVARALASWDA